jgi:hypothetical protein
VRLRSVRPRSRTGRWRCVRVGSSCLPSAPAAGIPGGMLRRTSQR